MVIVPTDYEYSFVALDARLNSALDPIPESFEGVSAHYIEQWCRNPLDEVTPCGGLSSRPYSYPPSPNSITHVTPVGGETRFVFIDDILWLAESGVTRGCSDTSYCPQQNVTRGQMAAFLVRALGYSSAGAGDLFVDDDDSTFELDIDKLATAGVTAGCNPPVNDHFCPDKNVTREQMAAFLVRALGLTDANISSSSFSRPTVIGSGVRCCSSRDSSTS